MTAPAPAISKVALNVNVDQSGPSEVILTQTLLGMNPFVIVEMHADSESLTLDVEIGGREMSMASIGKALEVLAETLQSKGDDLTAQAKASEEQSVTLDIKASVLFADKAETADAPETTDERRCTCDGGSFFTAEQNAKRHPFLVNSDCPFHGTDAKGGTR